MDIVHSRVAGIDVHKKIIWAAVRQPGEQPGGRTVTVRIPPGESEPVLTDAVGSPTVMGEDGCPCR